MQFFNYVMRKVWLHQTRIGLSLYDVAGQGYLKESVRMHSSNAFTGWGLSYIIISYKAVIIKSMENKVDGEFFLHWFMYIHCSNLRIFFSFLQDLENYILELIPTLPQVSLYIFSRVLELFLLEIK